MQTMLPGKKKKSYFSIAFCLLIFVIIRTYRKCLFFCPVLCVAIGFGKNDCN